MSKVVNHKLKQSLKGQHKPLKVSIAFNKKNNQESPEKNDHVSEEMIKVPVGNKFVPPKHSSTPKPKRNSETKQVSLSDTLCIESKFQMKECFVLVERLNDNDLPRKVSTVKATVSSIPRKQKHQLKKITKIKPPGLVSVSPQNLSVRKGRKEQPSKNGESFVTTIPSEALKSFGLLDVPEPLSNRSRGSSLHSNTSVGIETPPKTSAACSSVDDNSSSHTESCNVIHEDDAELQTAASRLVEASAPILFQSNNAEDAAPLNSSSVSQPDPLEMGLQDTSLKTISPPVNVHCDYLYGLNERMNCKPDIINLNELDFSNPDVRLVAPYALRLDTSRDGFFLYAAAVSKKCEKFCCLIFGVLDHYLIAYSGHFLVDKDHLYDPINKVPVQLKEKVRGDIALEKIKAQIKTLPQFKDVEFGESIVQAIIPGSHRMFYAAYEEPGCTAFYRNVFLLGYVDGLYIVGVVADQIFFVMATKRLYSRNSLPSPGMQPIKFSPQMIEMIDLPLWLPYEHVVTMLEIRQILRHSREYACDFQRIVDSFGILDLERPSSTLFKDSGLHNRKKHNAWLEFMLNLCYNPTFLNSSNEFPVHPTNLKNAHLFSENVTKLWIQQLLRKIHEIKDSSLDGYINHADMSKMDFFTLDIKTFIANFLPLFGLSVDSKFQCQLLGPDGVPSAICSENLSADQIGAHIYDHHILPLLWDENHNRNFIFSPFSLIYNSHNLPLSDKCDLERLRWARSLVVRWSGGSYLELLQTLKEVGEDQFDNVFPAIGKARQKKRAVESQSLNKKRRLASEECTSSSPKRGRRSADTSLINSD
ncbi:hypothetical protein DAPPUDRAFT_307865 [Daphnia pulex]|uniref:Uncharacterized protein n=1 Tax=Daphnia pulex TaxID=6669 RepID=E9G1X8_DAPPU|nr:hypothetical protein DAPPUDRAFT_307865 [Daphnia pulex]|eukprot:EFX86731.1 hypothetical protein DAPPUDRAFT_307865 [Daphnia pulex]